MAGERVFEGLPASVSPITGDLPAAKSGQETSGIPITPLTFSLATCYITNNFTQAVKRRVHDRRLAKRASKW